MGSFEIATLFFTLLLIQSHVIVFVESQKIDKIYPGFHASAAEFNDTNGVFLFSNSSVFALRFYSGGDDDRFSLGITHVLSSRVVWTANRDSPVNDYALFVFDESGDVYLEGGSGWNGIPVWSTETIGDDVVSMQLLDSGNLVLQSGNGSFVWQSFHHPTDTLLPGQVFWEGKQLKSYPNDNNLSNYLEMKQGDLMLFAGYGTPQIYWALSNESRKIQKAAASGGGGYVLFAVLESNFWSFYDQKGDLLWQFKFFWQSNWDDRWVAVLNTDGSISFHNLEMGKSAPPEPIRIPQSHCGVPEPCDPYFVCYFDNRCQCPSILDERFNCKFPHMISSIPCNGSSADLLYLGKNLDYFALRFSKPSLNSDLNACKAACASNCFCHVLFFEPISGNCFLFDHIGSLQRSEGSSGGYTAYMKTKVPNNGGGAVSPSPTLEPKTSRRKHIVLMSMVLAAISLTSFGLLLFFCYRRKVKELMYSVEDATEEDNFLDHISATPIRFSFRKLRRATKNFSTKIGHGGFGSVYLGQLPDGSTLAVKKLERIGQGAREFRAEVSLIGSTHHVNLVKLKGFCSESHHRLLAYEYMSNGSLDKWIFKNNDEGPFLDWDTRFNIALGTAKALAYLHEECEVKIVHCDIKPENVLLDDNFVARVSDFGMAKLMNREQSFICTQLRGTRGYVAPEWITNLSISDKSDVYSYGMVLLEIIGGRKNYDAEQPPEKAHFPSYTFKMVEENNARQVLDPKLEVKENDERVERAIEVALWCIQEEVNLRPPMRKVVQMLEGVSPVPMPPTCSQMSSSFSWSSGVGTMMLGLNGYFSEVRLSDVRLSGPR